MNNTLALAQGTCIGGAIVTCLATFYFSIVFSKFQKFSEQMIKELKEYDAKQNW